MPTTYLNLLVYFNFVVVSYAVIVRWRGRRNGAIADNAGQRSMLIWLVHAWAFFAVGVALRLLDLYGRPTILMSAWGSAVYLHAFGALALDGYYHAKGAAYRKRAELLLKTLEIDEPH